MQATSRLQISRSASLLSADRLAQRIVGRHGGSLQRHYSLSGPSHRLFASRRAAQDSPATWSAWRSRTRPARCQDLSSRPDWRHGQSRQHSQSGPSQTSSSKSRAEGAADTAQSLTQRLRKLTREYGRAVLGVYLLISLIDFPFCWLAVRMLGTERIGHWEHVIVTTFWNLVGLSTGGDGGHQVGGRGEDDDEHAGGDGVVEEAQRINVRAGVAGPESETASESYCLLLSCTAWLIRAQPYGRSLRWPTLSTSRWSSSECR